MVVKDSLVLLQHARDSPRPLNAITVAAAAGRLLYLSLQTCSPFYSTLVLQAALSFHSQFLFFLFYTACLCEPLFMVALSAVR